MAIFGKKQRAFLASLTSSRNDDPDSEKSSKRIKKELKKEAKRQKQLAKKQRRNEPIQASDMPSTTRFFQMNESVDELTNIPLGGESQLTNQPVEDAETSNEVYWRQIPRMQDSINELSRVRRNREVQPTNEPVEETEDDDTDFWDGDSQIEYSESEGEAEKMGERMLGLNVSSPVSVSSPNLVAFTHMPEEADGDLPRQRPEPRRKGFLSRKRATTILPPKAPKRKMSFDIFSRSKKPVTELTISGPVGPVIHTGYAPHPLERTANLSISSPVGPVRHYGFSSHNLERVETPIAHSENAEGASSPVTTSADAAHMEEMITNLQNLQKLASEQKDLETVNLKKGDKLSSLSKSKSMFLNAKQAVLRRFSSTAEKEMKMKAKDNSSFLDTSSHDPDSEKRINRRVAEGNNLGSPKVQYLTGDGRVPRKPLPTYKSTEWLRSGSPDDPFTEKLGMAHYVRSSYSQSSPEIDLSPHKNPHASRRIDTAPPPPMPKFSNTISGLAQHPQVNVFSSSPLGTSTPRDRFEPQIDRDGEKRLTGTTNNRPSAAVFHSIGWDEDNTDQEEHYCEVDGQKQKTNARGLRTSSLPQTHKAENGAAITTEDQHIAKIFSDLDAEAEDARILASKNTNGKIARASRHTTGTGLGISYSGKAEAATTDKTVTLSKPQPNRLAKPAKRSYIPRPVPAANYPVRSERKTSSTSPYHFTGGEDMSTDELEKDVSAYQIGGRRRRRS